MPELIELTPPGEYLQEILEELGVSAYRLAKDIHVSQDRISHILRGNRSITPDTAIRLGRYLGQSPQFWLGLQMDYDLRLAEREQGAKIHQEIAPCPALV